VTARLNPLACFRAGIQSKEFTMNVRNTLQSIALAAMLTSVTVGGAQACMFGSSPCQGKAERTCPTQEDRHVGPESCGLDKEEVIQGVSRMAAGGVEMAMRVMRAVAEEIDRQLRPADDI